MSQENVELHGRAFEAFNDRDLDAFLALADRDIELAPLNLELEGGAYRGHPGVRTFWNEYLSVFPDFSVDFDELRALGDLTVARVRLRGHGGASDVPFEEPIWQVAEWRRMQCVWWHSFRSEAEALEAARMREERQP
ncbi:MAG: nuclear transport factor 2 family protein [Solirubrobacterales bacterium]